MAKETVHGTNMIEQNNQASAHGAEDAYTDGGMDVSGGFNPKDVKGRQAVTTADVSSGDDGQFNYVDTKFDSNNVFDGKEGEAGQRPTLPHIEEPGSIPNPGDGFSGNQIGWDSVAPYKYPEFPADSNPTTNTSGLPVPVIGG